MKKETFNEELEVMVTSEEGIIEPIDPDTEPDTDGEGEGENEEEDKSTRPNRGTGTTGPKNPIGGGNKGQYSLKNDNNE